MYYEGFGPLFNALSHRTSLPYPTPDAGPRQGLRDRTKPVREVAQ